jgi:cation:H+ antiporter
VVIFASSQLFVNRLDALGPIIGVPPQLVALLLSPVATELPEIMNALIWIRQGKAQLALANISDSMMIQATVPSAFGLFFTTWLFDRSLILAGAVTIVAIAGLTTVMRKNTLNAPLLAGFLLLYGVFIGITLTL